MRSAGSARSRTPTGRRSSSPEQYEWNHGIGETVQAVIDAGLRVTALREHTELEWQGLPQMVEGPDGKFRLPEGPSDSPLMFTLEAVSGVGGERCDPARRLAR